MSGCEEARKKTQDGDEKVDVEVCRRRRRRVVGQAQIYVDEEGEEKKEGLSDVRL